MGKVDIDANGILGGTAIDKGSKNQADSMVYQTEKQLQELGDKVPAEMKTKVEGKLAELKEAVASGSVEGMKAAQDSLQQEVMAMGQSMYSQGGGAEGGTAPGAEGEGSAPPPPPNDDDVVDADFTDAE